RLEDQRDAEIGRDLLQALCRPQHQRLRLDDAWAGDQKQLIRAAIDVADENVLVTHGSSSWNGASGRRMQNLLGEGENCMQMKRIDPVHTALCGQTVARRKRSPGCASRRATSS